MRPLPFNPPRPFHMAVAVTLVSSPLGIPVGTLKFASVETYLGAPFNTEPVQAGAVVVTRTLCEYGLGRFASRSRPGVEAAASQREYAAVSAGSGRSP